MNREFIWKIRIYYEDTDAAGVVFYANYLRYMERARTEYLRALGFEHQALIRDNGILFVVRHIQLDYYRPARLDDEVAVHTCITHIGGASLAFKQDIIGNIGLICAAKIRLACLDAGTFRPKKLPKKIICEIGQPYKP